MPQSTKDSRGGKSTATRKTGSSGAVSNKAASGKAGARNPASPTGPNKHGEKKTTP